MGNENEFTFVCKNIEEAKTKLPDIKREMVQRLIHDYEIKIQALEELLEE